MLNASFSKDHIGKHIDKDVHLNKLYMILIYFISL